MTTSSIPGIPPEIVFDRPNEKLVARLQECLVHEQAESFKENLERLAGFAHGGGKVRIGLDFAELSFGFAVIRKDGSTWIHGGLTSIIHGGQVLGEINIRHLGNAMERATLLVELVDGIRQAIDYVWKYTRPQDLREKDPSERDE